MPCGFVTFLTDVVTGAWTVPCWLATMLVLIVRYICDRVGEQEVLGIQADDPVLNGSITRLHLRREGGEPGSDRPRRRCSRPQCS